jgi:hypothetical protein
LVLAELIFNWRRLLFQTLASASRLWKLSAVSFAFFLLVLTINLVIVVIPELIALVTEGEPASHGIGRWLIVRQAYGMQVLITRGLIIECRKEEAEDSAPFYRKYYGTCVEYAC